MRVKNHHMPATIRVDMALEMVSKFAFYPVFAGNHIWVMPSIPKIWIIDTNHLASNRNFNSFLTFSKAPLLNFVQLFFWAKEILQN